MRPHLALLVLAALPAFSFAQDAHLQQQRTSFAYREMREAQRKAELTEADTQDLEANAARLREQLEQVNRQISTARKQAADNRAKANEAYTRWMTESESLEKLQTRPAQ
jgi:septal ring factor EnvC (AmiA/AmiB activator)